MYNHWNEELSDEFQWLDTARKWIHDLEDGFKDTTQHIEVKERDVKYIKERLKKHGWQSEKVHERMRDERILFNNIPITIIVFQTFPPYR